MHPDLIALAVGELALNNVRLEVAGLIKMEGSN
jgi:hypothetical protein